MLFLVFKKKHIIYLLYVYRGKDFELVDLFHQGRLKIAKKRPSEMAFCAFQIVKNCKKHYWKRLYCNSS